MIAKNKQLIRKTFGIMVLSILSFNGYAFDNSSTINSLANKYLSLDSNMTLLKIDSVYCIYNKALFELDQQFVKKSYQGTLTASDFEGLENYTILRSKDSKINIKMTYINDNYFGQEGINLKLGDNKYGDIYGKLICLYRMDALYSFEVNEGRNYEYPGITKKYKMMENKFAEVLQPFYKMNFTTTVNDNISIVFSQDENDSIALIAEGTTVNVIGFMYSKKNDVDERWYLLEGKTGIIGWHKAYIVRSVKDSHNEKDIYSLDFLNRTYSLTAG